MNEPTNERTNKQTKERTNEWRNERRNKWRNQWSDEQMNQAQGCTGGQVLQQVASNASMGSPRDTNWQSTSEPTSNHAAPMHTYPQWVSQIAVTNWTMEKPSTNQAQTLVHKPCRHQIMSLPVAEYFESLVTDESTNVCMNEWMNRWKNKWMNNKGTNERTTNPQMNKRRHNKGTSDRMNHGSTTGVMKCTMDWRTEGNCPCSANSE